MPHRHLPLAQALSQALQAILPPPQTQEAERCIVVVGVGSTLRSDDAAGLRIAQALAALAPPNVVVLLGDTAPENITGEVRRARPSHVLFVDTADLGESPGSVRLLEAAEVDGMSSSTHTLPLGVIADYLTRELGCRVLFLGLQPKSVAFGESLSPEVAAAVAETTAILARALRTCGASPSRRATPAPSHLVHDEDEHQPYKSGENESIDEA